MSKFAALRLAWLICTWTVLGTLPSLPFFLLLFLYFNYIIIYFIIFYSLLFFIILLGMDPKCLLTSTDLQTRRARCQHQLSFLFVQSGFYWTVIRSAISISEVMTIWCFRNSIIMKKRSEETQTLHAGCSKAEPKISPRRRPPSRWLGTAKI